MKCTLLQMVQKVAAKLGGDEISVIDETIEAVDIKNEILSTFDDLVSIQEWEWLRHIPRQLDARTVNPTQPACVLNVPDDVIHIESLMYEAQSVSGERAACRVLRYLSPAAFQQMVMKRPVDSVTQEFDIGGIAVRIHTNRNPSYFTLFDESVVVFDAYDSSIDTTGISYSKTSCIARVVVSAVDDEDWQPVVPEWFYNLWYHESVSRCSSSIRGVEDGRSERMARRAMTTAIRMDNVGAPNYVDDGVNYGR